MPIKVKTTEQDHPKDGEHGNQNQRNPRPGFKNKMKNVKDAHPTYLSLVHRFPLRPIRTDSELETACAMIDELTDLDDASDEESDYLEVLGDLVRKYEDEHVAMPLVSDAEMLLSLMEEKGSRQADVVRGTGISKTVISLILSGKRQLTRDHIEALSRYFNVNPASFLGPHE
jgi:HTH-type transcriptional regulator/antitoxin HigA